MSGEFISLFFSGRVPFIGGKQWDLMDIVTARGGSDTPLFRNRVDCLEQAILAACFICKLHTQRRLFCNYTV